MHRSNDSDGEVASCLDEALGAVVQETIVRARQHEADGRYRDAEYLFRRASSNEPNSMETVSPYQSEDVLPTLVSIYEKLGDYPVAEMAQETLLRRLFATSPNQITEEQTRAVCTYSKMLSNFQERIHNLGFDLEMLVETYIDLFIVYRVAVLDIPQLNEVSLDQGLIPIQNSGGTVFHIAVKENAVNLASLLIKKGIRVSSRDPKSVTPLHIAAQYAEAPMVKLLLANGADVEAVDDFQRTPLQAALQAALIGNSDEQKLALLIYAQADMEVRDALGRTA